MAGNDLLNGFQAGMQAFAPLVNATLQRKKDERDTAARMGELRLQSELQGNRDAAQNTFTTARDATLNQYGVANAATQDRYRTGEATTAYNRGVTTAATENANKVTAAEKLAFANSQQFKATLNSAAVAAIRLNDNKVTAAEVENKNAVTAAAVKVEAEKQAAKDRLLGIGSAEEDALDALATRLQAAQKIMGDSVSDPAAKAAAGTRAWAINTRLGFMAEEHKAMLQGVAKSGDPSGLQSLWKDFSVSALPGFAPKPTAPKTYTLTDSLTGEQNVYIPVEGPNGTELKRVPKEGAAPAAPGIPGAISPKKPGVPPGKGADAPKAPTSKYWNAPVPATP